MSVRGCLVVLTFVAAVGSSHTPDCSYLSLLNHLNLTTSNDALVLTRPVKNWTVSTEVKMDMFLYGLLGVDEKAQTVTSHIWVQMSWMNEFLTWNPADFCGIRQVIVPRKMLWMPNVFIQEDASDIGTTQMSLYVSVSPSGLILFGQRQRLTSTCCLNLSRFPFDSQRCNITFSSMTNEEMVTLGKINNDTTLTAFSEAIMITRGEWALVNMEVEGPNASTKGSLTYMVTIIRKPMLYVMNFIIPLFYLLVLDLASFFISEARGEKLGFKVTVLLSISVLLLILQDILPSTEDRLPTIASYCVGVFALVGLSVLEAMVVCFLLDLDDHLGKIAPSSATDVHADVQIEGENHNELVAVEEKGEVKPERSDLLLERDLLKLILKEVKAAQTQEEKKKPGRYAILAHILDTVYFALYFATVVVFLIYIFSIWIPSDYFK
ncbi:5-hydroxytryptamine receptor 3A [Aulostomus maculatus]